MRQGRFITTAAAAAAVLAIGPASALATPGSFTDDNYADFAAGTATSAWTVEPGEVRLLRTTALGTTNFDALPSGWSTTPWNTGGSVSITGGSAIVDGASVHDGESSGTFQQQTLEFRATFSGQEGEHVGLGNDFNAGPWAMFSTGPVGATPGFWARTLMAGSGTPVDIQLPANIVPTVSHLYRIDWTATGVTFYVDGVNVGTSSDVIPTGTMRPVASDLTPGGGSVKVDWLNLGPYPASGGGFESRVFDAGTDPDVTWGSLIASAAAGAPVIKTRTGNTPNPNDGTWSQPAGLSGNVIASPRARYIQYITTDLTSTTPSLEKVVIGYDVDTSTPPSTGGSSGGSTGGTTTTGGGSKTSGGSNSQADTTKPKVTLVAKSLKASKKGTVSFTVGCPATEQSCKITLKLKNGTKTVASKTVNVKGGKTKTVTLTLNKATKSLLKKRSSLKVSAVTTATDAAGNTRTTTKAMTLRRAGR
jgi:hypothetical protein